MKASTLFEVIYRINDAETGIYAADLVKLEDSSHAYNYFNASIFDAPDGIAEGMYLTLYPTVERHRLLMELLKKLSENGEISHIWWDAILVDGGGSTVILVHIG